MKPFMETLPSEVDIKLQRGKTAGGTGTFPSRYRSHQRAIIRGKMANCHGSTLAIHTD